MSKKTSSEVLIFALWYFCHYFFCKVKIITFAKFI